MSNIQERLSKLGLSLPHPSSPGGNYVSVNVRNDIAYISIQFPIVNGEFHYQGKLGADLNTQEGKKAMEMCALNVLSQVNSKIGFEKVVGLNHIDAYYRSSNDWDEAPKVVDGASDLFVKLLGEKGRHSRAIFGVERLPRDFSVGLTSTWTVMSA